MKSTEKMKNIRKYCLLNQNIVYQGRNIRKLLYHIGNGFRILYSYPSHKDSFGWEIPLPEQVNDIEAFCWEQWGISAENWVQIQEAWEFCNLDFITPTRRKGRNTNDYFGEIYEQFNYQTHQWEEVKTEDLF